jgi:hypothetical protein
MYLSGAWQSTVIKSLMMMKAKKKGISEDDRAKKCQSTCTISILAANTN